jgi:hypothetical protein
MRLGIDQPLEKGDVVKSILSRRGLIGSSAALGLGATLPMVRPVALPVSAQDATPEAGQGVTPGQMNTGTLETSIGPLDYVNGYPTNETSQRLYDVMDFQRACQVYIWGIPAMGFWALRHAQREMQETPDGAMCTYLNFDDKVGMLTPNITTAYGFVFWNMVEQGPLVIEVPPAPTAGGVLDIWQRPVTDIGQTGPDGGNGGKYLIVPPGSPDSLDAEGYFTFRSPTNQLWIATRGLDPNPVKAVAALEAHRLYTWDERDNPPALQVNTVGGRPWASAQPADITYFAGLHEILDPEPVEERDRFFMAMMRPLGIIPGEPFAPDNRLTDILSDAAAVGQAMAQNIDYNKRFPNARVVPEANWDYALLCATDQRGFGYEQLDERTSWFYEAIGNSRGMQGETVGAGQVYLDVQRDADNEYLDGGVNYRLHVPADVPVAQFWSMTAYDNLTRGPVVTDTKKADISSRQTIVVNADGTTDVYFGPDSPGADLEHNWVKTAPGRGWFAYFRFYGPLQPYFDKIWTLPDVEKA